MARILTNIFVAALLTGLALYHLARWSVGQLDPYGLIYLCIFGIFLVLTMVRAGIDFVEDLIFTVQFHWLRRRK